MTESNSLSKPHRSFSQKNQLLWCGHQYWLTRVMHAPEAPSWSLVAGKALHAAAEVLGNLHSAKKNPGSSVALGELWKQQFAAEIMRTEDATGVPMDQFRAAGRKTKDKPNGEDYEFWLVEGSLMCLRYQAWLESCNMEVAVFDGVPMVEAEITTAFGDVQVKSFLDLCLTYGNARALELGQEVGLMVVDIKTGSRKIDSTEQLGQYATQVEQLFGVRPKYGAFWMARTGELTAPDVLDRWDLAHFTKQYEIVDKTITQGLFLPRIGSHCVACPVARFCHAVGGADADAYKEAS